MFDFQPIPPENAVEPKDVRFTDLRCEPWSDGQRVRVLVAITPFQKRPNLEAHIFNSDQEEVASASVIETMTDKLVFTMHLRGQKVPEHYTLVASISYEDLGIVDEGRAEFDTSELTSEEQS
jgi:hypothetical protein